HANEAARYREKHREKSVSDGIAVFRSDRWKNREFYTFVNLFAIPNVIRPAIHGHVMAARDEACRQLLRECLEPTVVCRNAAGSKDRQFHPAAIIDYAASACP